ncbi:hypothetical protein BpHYR1_047456 [Brachionus plicatilis]|uniref:Uncharacterized protein n=1 Tax=Brachionus plicatilis TaxID=10195 RepID=A0A3M7QBB7_BRAPC|nr:hypothetical protein BpHYR1_047456 [Brachionus plicatilis]
MHFIKHLKSDLKCDHELIVTETNYFSSNKYGVNHENFDTMLLPLSFAFAVEIPSNDEFLKVAIDKEKCFVI